MRLSPSAIVAQRVTALPRSASGKILYRALEACRGQPE
jgi:acyl-coenzyme A synthetase/AMP-(fatty) acid ligase